VDHWKEKSERNGNDEREIKATNEVSRIACVFFSVLILLTRNYQEQVRPHRKLELQTYGGFGFVS
jgi:hypothetical protein